MPRQTDAQLILPEERHREVAAIFAIGVQRLRRPGGIPADPDSQNSPETGLEFSGETRLSVSHGTRKLRLPDEGDNA